MKQMNRTFISAIILIVAVGVTISGALASGESVQFKTKGYENQVISFNGIEREVNVKVDMNFRERCDGCKFNAYQGSGRLRIYWNDGRRNAIEIRNIKPDAIEFSEGYTRINGEAGVVVDYTEGNKRVINKEVPVEIFLNKNTNQIGISFYDGTIYNINTQGKD